MHDSVMIEGILAGLGFILAGVVIVALIANAVGG